MKKSLFGIAAIAVALLFPSGLTAQGNPCLPPEASEVAAPKVTRPVAAAPAPKVVKAAKPKPVKNNATASVVVDVTMTGPTDTVLPGEGFQVFYEATPDTRITFKNTYPEKAGKPIIGVDEEGNHSLGFFRAVPGDYVFMVFAQASVNVVDGYDPFDMAMVTVHVGPAVPVVPPPVVVDPTVPPVVTPGPIVPVPVVTAVAYVYEKNDTQVPPAVMSGLNRLNREKKIIATLVEQDLKNGPVQIPEQYKLPIAAAKEKGLPALVVMSGSIVLNVIKDPKTEDQVYATAP